MNVLILKPRLDVMFKKGPVPTEKGAIAPIRVHWQNFVEERVAYHNFQKDNVKVIELPLWQMTPKLVEDLNADLTYIPHKELHCFPTPPKVKFYMQTVIPWLFSVDERGWGGGKMTQVKMDGEKAKTGLYEEYQEEYIKKNLSKFDQPKIQKSGSGLPPNFIFFPCQLPHDETIKYHSDYSVAECLSSVITFATHWGIPLVVKGHPINPGSMTPLREIVHKAQKKSRGTPLVWVEDVSIHQCLANCTAVYTVNSGVGLEAILHGKKVFRFGSTDYDAVTKKIEPTYQSIRNSWQISPYNPVKPYARFFEKYVQSHVDTRKWAWDRLPR